MDKVINGKTMQKEKIDFFKQKISDISDELIFNNFFNSLFSS